MQVSVGEREGPDRHVFTFLSVERNAEGRRGGGSSDPFASEAGGLSDEEGAQLLDDDLEDDATDDAGASSAPLRRRRHPSTARVPPAGTSGAMALARTPTSARNAAAWQRATYGVLKERMSLRRAADELRAKAQLEERLQRLQRDVITDVAELLGKVPPHRPSPVRMGDGAGAGGAGGAAISTTRTDSAVSWTDEVHGGPRARAPPATLAAVQPVEQLAVVDVASDTPS